MIQETREATKDRQGPSLRNWEPPSEEHRRTMQGDASVDMGWGRLFFGHTFASSRDFVAAMCDEGPGKRNLALYIQDPHVVLARAPQELFLDPSHTFRLDFIDYTPDDRVGQGFVVRHVKTVEDAQAVMRIFQGRDMVTCEPEFLLRSDAPLTYLVAESELDGSILGTVTGVDHVKAFGDPEEGTSLWCLAVDPQANAPGVGEALVRGLVEYYAQKGRRFIDLSVMHDNQQAIALYEKLGFRRVPVFCIKRKNPINEKLFLQPDLDAELNPYARIIVDEARRRGIHVEIIDPVTGQFRLTLGGRSVTCWESLTDIASAIALVRCDDKYLTHRVLENAGLRVPRQQVVGDQEADRRFLEEHGSVVVKPEHGEQGDGVHVDVRTVAGMGAAIEDARRFGPRVLLEKYEEGQDLRVIVIDNEVVAAALRRPPVITGTGEHTVRQLIEKYNRRRMAATGGESKVPFDDETTRCVEDAGYGMEDTLPGGQQVTLRKAANLHTGGTIHDCTDDLHPGLGKAAVAAAQALEIPVVGIDMEVAAPDQPDYVIVEANERPGLANHEPQPTAQRFLDFLFPDTAHVGK